MTRHEVKEKVSNFRTRDEELKNNIVQFSRSLVATLRDAGRPETAKELDRLLFELDAFQQEMKEFFMANLESILDTILPPGRPPR